jgi:hypothetical protein
MRISQNRWVARRWRTFEVITEAEDVSLNADSQCLLDPEWDEVTTTPLTHGELRAYSTNWWPAFAGSHHPINHKG